MNQSAYLYRLQKIDSQLDQVKLRLAEIERLFNEDERVRKAKLSVDEALRELEKARQALREIEYTVKDQQIKINQAESALYSGTIRNPKELQDLQKDIASLKKYLSTLEDQQLQAMMDLEEAELNEKTITTAYHQTQADSIQQKAGLAGEREQLLKNQNRLDSERAASLSLITPSSLETYQRIREQKKGIAVSAIIDEDTCSICGSEVRPAEIQTARLSNFIYCSSCGRILYAG
jgi:uncharacterized protein